MSTDSLSLAAMAPDDIAAKSFNPIERISGWVRGSSIGKKAAALAFGGMGMAFTAFGLAESAAPAAAVEKVIDIENNCTIDSEGKWYGVKVKNLRENELDEEGQVKSVLLHIKMTQFTAQGEAITTHTLEIPSLQEDTNAKVMQGGNINPAGGSIKVIYVGKLDLDDEGNKTAITDFEEKSFSPLFCPGDSTPTTAANTTAAPTPTTARAPRVTAAPQTTTTTVATTTTTTAPVSTTTSTIEYEEEPTTTTTIEASSILIPETTTSTIREVELAKPASESKKSSDDSKGLLVGILSTGIVASSGTFAYAAFRLAKIHTGNKTI